MGSDSQKIRQSDGLQSFRWRPDRFSMVRYFFDASDGQMALKGSGISDDSRNNIYFQSTALASLAILN